MLQSNLFPIAYPKSRLLKWTVLFLIICIPVIGTLPQYGVTFDEPIYMEAAWNVEKWLSLESTKILDKNEIARYWRTDPQRNIHPSGLKWLYIAAQNLIFWEDDPYRQNALFCVLLFSFSLLVFLEWWYKDSILRGVIFVILLYSMPRFFAHTHFPATDIPMTSFLMLFLVSIERTLLKRTYWVSGIALGAFLSIKFTSALLSAAIIVVFIWWYKEDWRKVFPRILLISLIGLLVFYLSNPDWWYSPISRGSEYLTQSLTRRSWAPFTVYFAGDFYSYRGPFYYPFVMFLITTPLLHFLLLVIGVAYSIFQKHLLSNSKSILSFTCLVFPFILLSLPQSPAHDGIRYLIPAFPFAAYFMTLGTIRLWRFVSQHSNRSRLNIAAKLIVILTSLTLIAADTRTASRVPPFELSYYNKILGGLPGAHSKGFEITYWIEILNDDVLDQLNRVCANSTVYFPATPTDLYFKHMIESGKMSFRPVLDPKKAKFMLIIGRPSVEYWESRAIYNYRRMGKTLIPIWDISIDSVRLMQLFMIK